MPTVRLFQGPFTVEQFQRLEEVGLLDPEGRFELIDGQVLEMSPIGKDHAACVRQLGWLLTDHLGPRARVDWQNPVVLGKRHQPQPDLVLLKPRGGGYRDHPRPSDILLIVEVADTSLEKDRAVKLPLYARAGLAEYWIVNIPDQRIEVYRDPSGDGYATTRFAIRGQTVSPLCAPDVTLEVAEILG